MPVDGLPPYDEQNIFARILRGEIPCRKVFEDDWGSGFSRHQPPGTDSCPGHSERRLLLLR